VAQTEGKPLPEISRASGDPGPALDRLRQVIASRRIALTYADDLGGALGLSSGDRISVLRGLTPAVEFGVLAHELAHLCEAIRYVRFLRV
jgi:hypothetical protein